MTGSQNHYKKYQVYFFLYLAVICELLIIIVERDDAEAELMAQQRNLEEKNRRIILELLKNMPAVSSAGDNQLKINETRSFTVSVKGLGDRDDVTSPPLVNVMKDGQIVATLTYPGVVKDSVIHGSTGERLYRFDWTADKGPGRFELMVQAGTNRVAFVPDETGDARVKVGSLEFSERDIQTAIDSDPILKGTPVGAFIDGAKKLPPNTFVVDVVSEEYDQLQIQADPIVTSVGYAAFNEIKVRGTTADKVSGMNATAGMVLSPTNTSNPWFSDNPERGKWTWTNSYPKPGTYTVTIDARDKRNAGPKSSARPVTFDIVVKAPYLTRPRPSGAYAGESFEQYISVAGLDDIGGYRWTVKLDNDAVAEGRGNVVRYFVPEKANGKALSITAEYRGKSYLLLPDSGSVEAQPSTFLFPVSKPRERIVNLSFAKNGEYPINNVFSFKAIRCGRCVPVNIRNAAASEIRIDVSSEDGRDLLDEVTINPRVDGSGMDAGTHVQFYLKTKGKISRDGMDALVKISFGSTVETIPVRLFPE